MLDHTNDTIVAVSSPPGTGAVGVVRLDGPDTLTVADRFCHARGHATIGDVPLSSRVEGDVALDDGLLLPAVLHVFKAPRSYTRNHLVEIRVPGGQALIDLVVERATRAGARRAEPGEFTARAFLNGAMSLDEAEAVAGVIQAGSDRALSAARRARDGALTRRIEPVSAGLTDLAALVEADIDFADEPIEFIAPAQLVRRMCELDDALARLEGDTMCAERVSPLPRVLLFGRPNAGKSTLMNALAGMPRSLCSPLPGTTRDVLAAHVRLGEVEAMLLDAAGVDVNGDAIDDIAAAARSLSLAEAGSVDVVALVVDAGSAADLALLRTLSDATVATIVLVLNKIDAIDDARQRTIVREWRAALSSWRGDVHEPSDARRVVVVRVSALRGDGLDEMRRTLAEALGPCPADTMSAATILLTQRQLDAVSNARLAIGRAVTMSQSLRHTSDGAELLAFELREALDALGCVTGAVTPDDLLGHVFARFCIGK